MRSRFKKVILLVLSVLMLLSMSITAFAFGDGGGGAGNNSGGYPDAVNRHYSGFGFKMTLQKRADLLRVGGVNSNAYNAGLKNRSGYIVMFNAHGEENTGFFPSNELYYNGGSTFEFVHNEGLGLRDFCNLFQLDYNRFASLAKQAIHYDGGGDCFADPNVYVNYSAICNFLTQSFNKDSDRLYDTSKREAFYDWYKAEMGKFGCYPGVTKEEFMSDVGVLVVEPIMATQATQCGFGETDPTDGWLMTFQTAEAVARGVNGNKSLSNIITLNMFGKDLGSNSTLSFRSPMYGNAATNRGMVNAGTVTNYFDLNGDQFRNTPKSTSQVLANPTNNWDTGYLVFGADYSGSKAATNVAIKATQQKDGSFKMEAVTSTISQKKGNMPVDTNSFSGTSQNNEITGGQSYGGNVSTLVTNLYSDWYKDFDTTSYGSYLVTGNKKKFSNIATEVERFRKTLEGNTQAKKESVTEGDFNAGYKLKPNWRYGTTQGTASAFAQSVLGGRVSQSLITNKDPGSANLSNIAYNLTALANNRSKVGPTELKSTSDRKNAGSGKLEISGNKDNYGVSVEYVVKPAQTTSYISYAKMTYDKDLNPTLALQGNNKITYDKTENGKFTVGSAKRYVITMVSNCKANDYYKLSDSNRTGQSFWNQVKAELPKGKILNESTFRTIVNRYLTSQNTTSLGTKQNASVAVGSDGTCGYSVFVIEIDAPKDLAINQTRLELQDYQINYIHQDILAYTYKDGESSDNKSNLKQSILKGTGENVVIPGSGYSKYCTINGGTHWTYQTSGTFNLNHPIAQGVAVDAGNKNGYTYLLANTALNAGKTFNEVRYGTTDSGTRRYTYALDLTRGNFGDIRNISALSWNQWDYSGKSELMNKHKMGYGIKPANDRGEPVASQKRSSKGTIYKDEDGLNKKSAEVLEWNTSWKYGGTAPQAAILNSHSKVVWDSNGKSTVTCTYHTISQSGARPLDFDGLGLYRFKIAVKETIYKYSTEVMSTGKNKKLVDIGNGLKGYTVDSKHYSDKKYNDSTGLQQANDGKYNHGQIAQLADSKKVNELKYYPEVPMKAYLLGNYNVASINGKSSITPTTVLTMAEQIRKTKPSSLYLLRLESRDREALNGSIYSDTMGTGTKSKKAKTSDSKNLPVIYGGSDVSVKVATKDNLNLHMYGYALDLINYDIDKNGLKHKDGPVTPYSSVIADQSSALRDVYTSWGNDDTNSAEAAKEQYNNWVKGVLKNLSADATLKITKNGNGITSDSNVLSAFNNFNVSLSKPKDEDIKDRYYAKDDVSVNEAYSIVVRCGNIDKNKGDYNSLINQIASDYGCSYSEAETVFRNSGIYQSIADSVEDITDSFNRSQNVNTSEGGSHAVRNDNTGDNWYDEEVKTFVVRRFESAPFKIKDLVLTDKIDYKLTPDSTAGKKNSGNSKNAQQKSYDTRVGQWYLTLYIDKPTKTEELENWYISGQIYNPEAKDSLDTLKNANNVLMNNMYIKGADFKIPSATTNDTLW